MGATNFAEVGRGKTIESAFANAVKQAQYDYGHSGYTGSIAEKYADGFVEFERVKGYTAEKIEGLVWKAHDHLSDLEWAKQPGGKPKPQRWSNETPEQFKARVSRERKWARENKQAYERLLNLYGAVELRRLIEVACGSKWGPCAAIAKSKTQWLFFGMASC